MSLLPLLLTGCTATDTATWRTEATEPADTEVTAPIDWEEDAGEEEAGKWLWGELDDDEGITGFFYADEEEALCEVIYVVDDWGEDDTCTDCDGAWYITRSSDSWIEINVDGACEAEGWTALADTTFRVGYRDETLLADLGSGWAEVVAEGEAEDGWLAFGIWLGE